MALTEKWRLFAASLIAATGLTRFLFRSHYLYDIDSVNFALALKRFDTTVHQPHPPGYFLYICLGRLASLIFHDANSAFVAISILFSCAAVAMICLLTDCWFGRGAARFAGLIFLFSPLAWFHGTVALTYIVEAFFSALVGYLCWRADRGDAGYFVPAAVAVGVAAGFRPSSILFLAPLLLYSMRRGSRKQAVRRIAALILTLLAWFMPMIWIAGPRAWLSALVSLWLTVPGKASVFNSSPLNSVARAATIVGIYFLCFGSAALLALRAGDSPAEHRSKVIFTRVWIAPGLLFFTFVYLKFVNSGYLLIVAPPVFAWMGLWANNWYEKLRMSKPARALLIGACAAANAAIFIFAPFYCSYREVRRFESELSNILTVIPQIASPKDTMIVGLDSHFLGYRHAGYYLPRYLTVQFPEVKLAGMKVFAMRDQDTGLMTTINTTAIRNFVIFPLPQNDPEYSDYMAQLRKRIPYGDLRVVAQGGNDYALGPVDDLHCLFPRTAGER
jgi:4-amino-4-deoxy-L-arabinose transferase-like glycosyltransferase